MATVKVKDSVKPHSIVIGAAIANCAKELINPPEVWITSGNDSGHMKNSKHYTDDALDIRTKNFPTLQAKLDFVKCLKSRLGPNYDVFIEDIGGMNEHIHAEYDPKTVV